MELARNIEIYEEGQTLLEEYYYRLVTQIRTDREDAASIGGEADYSGVAPAPTSWPSVARNLRVGSTC